MAKYTYVTDAGDVVWLMLSLPIFLLASFIIRRML